MGLAYRRGRRLFTPLAPDGGFGQAPAPWGRQNSTERNCKILSFEKAKAHLEALGLAGRIQVFEVSSATVELAAAAVGVEGARIAKSLGFMVEGAPVLIVAAGDAKVDNRKFKEKFHTKAKMLSREETASLVGHEVGGVCPFGVNPGVTTYLDESLRRFETVFPAVGSDNSAVELSLDELERASGAVEWADLCKLPQETA